MRSPRRRRIGRRSATLAAAISALAAATAVFTPVTASAGVPNCALSHDLRKVADNDGGYWQLNLSMDCNENAAVYAVEWKFALWAEPQGGGPATAYFTNGGNAGLETRSTRGSKLFVQAGAPLGHARYCYNAVVLAKSPKVIGKGQDPARFVGTHCVDA